MPTGDPFEYYGQRNGQPSVTAESMRAAVEDPKRYGAQLEQLGRDLNDDSKKVDINVQGELVAPLQNAPTEVAKTATDVGLKGAYAVAAVEQFANQVEIFDQGVSDLNRRAETLIRLYASEAPLTQMIHDPRNFALSPSEARHKATAELSGKYKALLKPLNAAIETVIRVLHHYNSKNAKSLILAGYLPASSAGAYHVKLTAAESRRANIAAQALKLRGMTPQQQAAFIRSQVKEPKVPGEEPPAIDPALVAALSPEAQKLLSADVVSAIKSGKIDNVSAVLMKSLHEMEAFAHGVYSRVSAAEISNAVYRMSARTQALSQFDQGDGSAATTAALYEAFLNYGGATFATYASADPDGPYAPPVNLAETWGTAITRTWEEGGEHWDASALSTFLKHGGQHGSFDRNDSTFIKDVANQVYDYDVAHRDESPWGSRVDADNAQYFGVFDPDVHLGDPDNSLSTSVSVKQSYDALANVLGAMKLSPASAAGFFSDGGEVEYQGRDVNERLQYLLTDRKWHQDNGDGFGIALQGAATGDRTHSPAGREAAELASQTIFMIATESGKGDHPLIPNAVDGIWHLPEGMRDSVGQILASYPADIKVLADEARPWTGIWYDETPAQSDPFGLVGTKADLGTVLEEIGRGEDKSGIMAVVSSQLRFNQTELQEALTAWEAKHPDAPKTMEGLIKDPTFRTELENLSTANGRAIGFVMQHGLTGDQGGKVDADQANQFVAKAFGFATEFAPVPGGKVASVLTSTALSEMGDAIGAPTKGSGLATMGGDAIEKSFSYGSFDTLLKNGFLDPDVDPAHGVPRELTVGSGPDKVLNPKLYDYQEPDRGERLSPEELALNELRSELAQWHSGSGKHGSVHIASAPSRITSEISTAYTNSMTPYLTKQVNE